MFAASRFLGLRVRAGAEARADPSVREEICGGHQSVLRRGGGEQYSVECETGTGWEDNLEDVKCGQGWQYREACSVYRGLVSGIIITVCV